MLHTWTYVTMQLNVYVCVYWYFWRINSSNPELDEIQYYSDLDNTQFIERKS